MLAVWSLWVSFRRGWTYLLCVLRRRRKYIEWRRGRGVRKGDKYVEGLWGRNKKFGGAGDKERRKRLSICDSE